MPSERSAKLVLQYETDESQLRRMQQRSRQVREDLNKTVVELKSIDVAGRKAAASLLDIEATGLKQVTRDAARAEGSLLDLERQAERTQKIVAKSGSGGLNVVDRGLSSFGALARGVGAGAAGEALGIGADVAQAVEQLAPLRETIGSLGPVAAVAVVGIGAITLALAEHNRLALENTANIREIIDRERAYYELRVSGTTESIRAAIQLAEFEQQIAQARLDDLKFVLEGYEEAGKQLGVFTGAVIEVGGILNVGGLSNIRDARLAYEEANTSLTKANQTLELYRGLLDSTSTATNDAAEAEKKLASERASAFDKYLDEQLAMTLKAGQDFAEGARIRIQEEQTIRRESIDAVKRFNSEIENLNQRDADNKKRYLETVDKILADAESSARKLLDRLRSQEAGIKQSAQRDEDKAVRQEAADRLKIQIDAAREEIKIYETTRRRIRDILNQSKEEEFDLSLDRDFSALDRLRRRTQAQVRDAQQQQSDQVQDTQQAEQEKHEDLRRSALLERNERLIATQQRLADARANYNAERAQIISQKYEQLALAAQARRVEVQLYQAGLRDRQSAIQAELNLIAQGNAAKLRQEDAYLRQVLALRQGIFGLGGSAVSGGADMLRRRATGGPLGRGQTAIVQEGFRGQREAFNGVPFPPGVGLFLPLQSGQVTQSSSLQVNASIPININTAGSAEQVRALAPYIREQVREGLADFVLSVAGKN